MIIEGERLLKDDPANLKILLLLLESYTQKQDAEKTRITKAKLDLLIQAILMHGDGTSDSATLKVASVEDEYAALNMLGIMPKTRKSRTNTNSVTDVWKIKKQNHFPGEEFFVEVLYPF
ncbi:DUF4919 domain-containing protein [Niabella ginsengisoli]|uniref:DUF4919 domain-containing protein n=1 Tax=Niabella ginsengisoli TaxID=522298 RepID=A0ABS9SH85_9BACT|nr:DUF4919 domain-containing protein [Niabella ginsengisoli]